MDNLIFTLPNIPSYINSFKLRRLFGRGLMTDYVMMQLNDKGNGEMVEDMTLNVFFKCQKYTNILKSKVNDFYDFSLTNIENSYIDVRRFTKNELYLNYTSGVKKKKYKWQHKAETLQNGGYLGVYIDDSEFKFYFIPAQSLLKDHSSRLTNYMPVTLLNESYKLDIPVVTLAERKEKYKIVNSELYDRIVQRFLLKKI